MTKEERLSASTLFAGLNQDQCSIFAHIAEEQCFKKNEVIFFEGDAGEGFYILTLGKVKISKVSSAGKEHILHILKDGATFGEVPVFNGIPFPATATTLEQSSTLYFPRKIFIQTLQRYPSVALGMLAELSRKLHNFTQQIEALALQEVPKRLANYLIYLQQEGGNTRNVITLDISKGQLASLLGTSPETLSRIFSKMTNSGLITVQGRVITFLDLEGLQNLDQL